MSPFYREFRIVILEHFLDSSELVHLKDLLPNNSQIFTIDKKSILPFIFREEPDLILLFYDGSNQKEIEELSAAIDNSIVANQMVIGVVFDSNNVPNEKLIVENQKLSLFVPKHNLWEVDLTLSVKRLRVQHPIVSLRECFFKQRIKIWQISLESIMTALGDTLNFQFLMQNDHKLLSKLVQRARQMVDLIVLWDEGESIVKVMRSNLVGYTKESNIDLIISYLELLEQWTGLFLLENFWINCLAKLAETEHLSQHFNTEYLLTVVCHDLKAPLTIIKTNTELVKSTTLTSSSEIINRIERQANRGLRLIEDYLVFLQKTKKISLNYSNQSINVWLETIIADFKTYAERKRITLALQGPNDLIGCADFQRLAQVLDNLLTNAIKFTPIDGRITIRFSKISWRNKDAFAMLILEVHNTGSNVDTKNLNAVFDLFWQANQTFQGAGIGLHICRLICNLHGGDIWLESSEQDGTKVILSIPMSNQKSVNM